MCTKFVKEILSKKRKIVKYKTIALSEKCNVVIPNKLPTNLKEPDSIPSPYLIVNVSIDRALCDLGSSVNLMLYFIIKKLNLGGLRRTTI